MDNLLKYLETVEVLSIKDVIELKREINTDFIEQSNKFKVKVLYKAICKKIIPFLYGLDEREAKLVTQNVIENTLFKKRTIYCANIFSEILSLDLDYQEFKKVIYDWVSNINNYPIQPWILDDFLKIYSTNYYEKFLKYDSFQKIKESSYEFDSLSSPNETFYPFENIEKLDNVDSYEGTILTTVEETTHQDIAFSDEASTYDLHGVNKVNNHAAVAEYDFNTLNFNILKKHIDFLKNFKPNPLILSAVIVYLAILMMPKTNMSYVSTESIELDLNIENYDTLNNDLSVIVNNVISHRNPEIPMDFRFRFINKSKLKDYLKSRNSLLAEEPHISIIINTAKKHNLNPNILFALAGQEQGFVPKDNEFASKIVNNPYNVFTSWKKYNTDLQDSTNIACRTIMNLVKDRPIGENPFKWINRKYAQDENWWKGMNALFIKLESLQN